MRKNRIISGGLGLILAAGVLLSGCEPKPTVVPAQVDTEIARAKSVNDELVSLNPPETMTIYYRNLMSQAEAAKAKGDFPKAIDLAKQAADQAASSLKTWKDQIAQIRQKLDQAKDALETLYPVNYPMIKHYWADAALFQKGAYQALIPEADQLLKEIEQARNMSILTDRTIEVRAPPEYVSQWGDVRVYSEITPEGKFKNPIDTVPNGARVKFIRCRLFSPEQVIYFVEIPGSGKQGWISDKYLNVGEVKY